MKFFGKMKSFLSCILLFFIFSFVILSVVIPDTIVIGKDDDIKNNAYSWIIDYKNIESEKTLGFSNKKLENTKNLKEYELKAYFGKIIPIKDVKVKVQDGVFVNLGGQCVGINLKINGVLVAGFDEEKTSSGYKSGILKGDIIEKINDKVINSKEDFINEIEKSDSNLDLLIKRNGKYKKINVVPHSDNNGNKKLGIWIRDTISGIGTVTFYNNEKIATLGHIITDIDTLNAPEIKGGNFFGAKIVDVKKAKKGDPGSLKGIFTNEVAGTITKNTEVGVFGKCPESNTQKIELGKASEVKCKEAYIYSDVGDGVKKYNAKIARIINKNSTSKAFVIEITDKNLIKKTGGIVQGMSGSPIVQNGKLIGCITHVFVNDPTRGYGIFIENMLAETEKIK